MVTLSFIVAAFLHLEILIVQPGWVVNVLVYHQCYMYLSGLWPPGRPSENSVGVLIRVKQKKHIDLPNGVW